MAFVNSGRDLFATNMADYRGYAGTATGTGATSLTESGATWTTDQWIGHVVVASGVYGVVLSNTGTVLTIDKWYPPATPSGSGSTPGSTSAFVIVAGGQPAFWAALTENSSSPTNTDTTLSGELTGSGLQRRTPSTYTHSAGVNTFSLTWSWTSSDGTSRTINKVGIFNASATGRLIYSTLVTSPPVLVSGDQLTVTETVTTSSS